jgi:group I intron endonuclease
MSKQNKICGIYKITCIITNKYYIGSSINIITRWNSHKNDLKNNKHHSYKIQKTWNKYGEKNFIFEIIEECDPVKEIILEREQFYIDYMNPFFNICKIAGNVMGVKRTPETCKKISDARKGENNPYFGKKHKKETIQKMSNAKKGENNHNFGKTGEKSHNFGLTRTPEIKIKMRIAMKGKKRSQEACKNISESKKGDKHPQFGKFGEFNPTSKIYKVTRPDGLSDIITGFNQYCIDHNLNISNMSRVANGKQKHHKGYKCEHYSE